MTALKTNPTTAPELTAAMNRMADFAETFAAALRNVGNGTATREETDAVILSAQAVSANLDPLTSNGLCVPFGGDLCAIWASWRSEEGTRRDADTSAFFEWARENVNR
jgi:hypothetical protein